MNLPQPSARVEKAGIAQICISKPACSPAVLGSFIAADRLLKAWAAARDCTECGFEIRYLDSYRLCGRYPLWRKSTTRQSLAAHLRRLPAPPPRSMPERFLEHDEVEDFGEP